MSRVARQPLARGHLIVVLALEPVLHLNLLRLNLFLPQRIMVASTIEIDDVIGILKDRLRRSHNFFTNALDHLLAVNAVGSAILGDDTFSPS